MTIRVTSTMMNTQLLGNLNNSLYNMNKLENQISTGRKLNKPSDDPVGTTYALQYRSNLESNAQYRKNIDASVSWLDFTDSVMNQSTEIMKRMKELAVQGASNTLSKTDMLALKEEVKQLKDQMISIGNSEFNGKFIFNGQNYNQKPYELTGTTTEYSDIDTNKDAVNYMISMGVTFQVNVPGSDYFGGSADKATDNVFSVMNRMITALDNGDHAALRAELSHVESRTDKMLAYRAQIGARTNRAELMQTRLSDEEYNVTRLQSKTEDADIDKTLIESTTARTLYEAALKAASSMMNMSLVNFMN